MSAQGLLHSVFSCSSPASKTLSKRRLRQTRSLDPAIIRNYGTESTSEEYDNLECRALGSREAGVFSSHPEYLPAPKLDHRSKLLKLKQPISSFSSPSTPLDISPSSVFQFDYDPRVLKRSIPWDLPFLTKSQAASPPGSTTSIFSPRKWLQKKLHQSSAQYSIVWRSEGDFTWSSLSGRTVPLQAMPIQSLSELERVRLQEVAFSRLSQDYDMGCQITIPKDGHKRKKSLRRKLDSLAKEKNKDKEFVPQAFGMPLSQVIANDRTHKQRQDSHKDEHRDVSDLVSSILQFATKRPNKELSSSNSSVSSSSETPNESTSPNTPEAAPRARRRGAMSVDSITDLDDSQSRLLEALQLSLPAEGPSRKEKHRDKKLSLNPIYRQVPRLVDSCCQHLEKYGLQTVGIFRVGSSKKRVRQLREEFDRGMDVLLDEEHSIHDVAALLKEFLRDMPDPLLTKELYTAFINTMLLDPEEQQSALQLLIYLLPPCNCDTLHRLLHFLSTVAAHADDMHDKDGQEITGNKMTSLNLATIFGPNLLHKQKSSDKEFSVQSSARAEESTAIIAVVQRMIATYEILFMVPPDLQNEVLMSLLETDPDVVDYLLRRKASQWSHPEPFSLSERLSSSDSNKASSGEVSPYDNNSPVLAECPLTQHQGEESPSPEQLFPTQKQCPAQLAFKAPSKKAGLAQWDIKGLHGNISLEQLDNRQDNVKQTVLQTQAVLGLPQCRPHLPDQCRPHLPDQCRPHLPDQCRPHLPDQCRPHPPVMPMCSSPQDTPGCQPLPGQSAATLPDGQSVCSCMEGLPTRSHKGCDLHRSTVQQPGSSSPCGSGSPAPSRASPQHSAPALEANGPAGTEWQHWQRERWQIWQLLSSDNADTLPETLV